MTLFWITIILFVLVIGIGNYLLFNKVVPSIDESVEFMPSEQMNQVERYLAQLDPSEKKGFTHFFLQHYQKIQAIMGLLLLINILYFSIF